MSRFQRFETATIKRSEIKGAPYNPRTIDEHARKKLKACIKKNGLVGTLTWNKRTGTLVSGHQRLSILDDLERSQDYSLTVSVIDVDEKTEKELNVFMNNASTQGEWNNAKLDELIKDLNFDVSGLGFELSELQTITELPEIAGVFDPMKDKASSDIASLRETSRTLQAKARATNAKGEDDAEFYCVVVFRDQDHVTRFLESLKLPSNQRYVDGVMLADRLKIDIEKAELAP